MKSALIFFTIAVAVQGQSFSSGSTGAGGPLVLANPGTVIFDPRAFRTPLNPSGDNVYHFTTIYVAGGVTVKLSAKLLSAPVFWLAQGPVQIDGTIDLTGADGGTLPSAAGSGGFLGGARGQPGYSPRAFQSNVFLVPLVGGAGGNGGPTQGGGGGGGALLIASSASITVNGEISANGGSSADGRGGDGGAIRLVAPVIDGSGLLSARGGQPGGLDGRARLESFMSTFSGRIGATFSQGKPFGLFLPPDRPPSVRVVSAAGALVRGAELTISQRSQIAVVVEARGIPSGTILELQFFSEDGSSQTIKATPLEGTKERSRATASVTLTSGTTHVFAAAAWDQNGLAKDAQRK